MISNRLSRISAKTGNPKVCYPPPPLLPITPPTPPPPPQRWPPAYIAAEIEIRYQQIYINYSMTLKPELPTLPTRYTARSQDGKRLIGTMFDYANGQYTLTPYETQTVDVMPFITRNGPKQQVQPTGFQTITTNWQLVTPTGAYVKLVCTYP